MIYRTVSGSGRRKFDQEFSAGTVRLATKEKKTVSNIARSLGLLENLMCPWKRTYLCPRLLYDLLSDESLPAHVPVLVNCTSPKFNVFTDLKGAGQG